MKLEDQSVEKGVYEDHQRWNEKGENQEDDHKVGKIRREDKVAASFSSLG